MCYKEIILFSTCSSFYNQQNKKLVAALNRCCGGHILEKRKKQVEILENID